MISATHCDLEARVREGRFRADLYYRLAVLRIALPPLRERRGDLAALAEWSLKNALAALGARPHPNLHAEIGACAPLFERYDWPGNVRELRNLMQRLALYLAAEPLQALTPTFVLAVAPELGRSGGAGGAGRAGARRKRWNRCWRASAASATKRRNTWASAALPFGESCAPAHNRSGRPGASLDQAPHTARQVNAGRLDRRRIRSPDNLDGRRRYASMHRKRHCFH